MTTLRTWMGRNPQDGRPLRITVEDGRIRSVRPVSAAACEENLWLTPGLIDFQVNGYRGRDLNAGGIDAGIVIALTRQMVATGVTTFIPTIITAPEIQIAGALRAIAEARRSSPLAAHAIPFAHVEGPHLSPEDGARGAHPLESIRAPSLAEFARWQAASGGLVGMVTISPHWENAVEYISALASQGVLVAIGHTNAAPHQVHAAADAGAAISTHLGNGVNDPLPRHPNVLWAQLADDRLTATFIADGHHLPMDTLKAMLRAKGVERSIAVSDLVALAGAPPGAYTAVIGGRVELGCDGRLTIAGTNFLAGAVRPLKDDLALIADSGLLPFGDAIRLGTSNPGRFAGGRGILQPGADADLMQFRWKPRQKQFQIQNIVIQGEEWPEADDENAV